MVIPNRPICFYFWSDRIFQRSPGRHLRTVKDNRPYLVTNGAPSRAEDGLARLKKVLRFSALARYTDVEHPVGTRMTVRFLDPRLYQIGALAGLLIYGIFRLDFEIGAAQAAVTLSAALAAQWVGTRLFLGSAAAFDPKSALISGLSLCLLLRTNFLWLAAAGALAAVGGKFVLRWHGKHLFNPTNFGIVLLLLCADGCAWVSPGQWGNVAFFAFLMVCVGGLVVHRAARADVTLAFLGFYLALVFGRSAWLGEPLTIPLHRLQNGALLLFAFFMISDPRTTPDSRVGRIIFALLVAFGAAYVQFRLFRTNGLLWSLAACSLLVPVLDWLLPGARYRWDAPRPSPDPKPPESRNSDYETAFA
jgi:Na+-translocating ferredoxin:NAD+ oxidoreductase RnfD subunit